MKTYETIKEWTMEWGENLIKIPVGNKLIYSGGVYQLVVGDYKEVLSVGFVQNQPEYFRKVKEEVKKDFFETIKNSICSADELERTLAHVELIEIVKNQQKEIEKLRKEFDDHLEYTLWRKI